MRTDARIQRVAHEREAPRGTGTLELTPYSDNRPRPVVLVIVQKGGKVTTRLGGTWSSAGSLPEKRFECGYCGAFVGPDKGFVTNENSQIYLCSFCNRPTFFEGGLLQTPGTLLGESVQHIVDTDVEELYNEARRCTSTKAYTAAVLACRKILMHIAVAKGAEEDQSFKHYVEYLANNYHIPKGSEDWVAYIKDKANEANHEIMLSDETTGKKLLKFTGMLLKLVYEFPGDLKEGEQ